MKMEGQISEVEGLVSSLSEIENDITVPRNVRTEIQNVLNILKENNELPIKVNKALNKLEDIANDSNLHSYTRAQIWNIISLLEKLH